MGEAYYLYPQVKLIPTQKDFQRELSFQISSLIVSYRMNSIILTLAIVNSSNSYYIYDISFADFLHSEILFGSEQPEIPQNPLLNCFPPAGRVS